MSTGKQQEQPDGKEQINVHDADAVKQCAKELGIEEQYLIQAVYEVGPKLADIRAWLKSNKSMLA